MKIVLKSLYIPYFPSQSGPGRKIYAPVSKLIWSERLYLIDGLIKLSKSLKFISPLKDASRVSLSKDFDMLILTKDKKILYTKNLEENLSLLYQFSSILFIE